MATITRADLAESVRQTAGLSGAESYKLVDLFFAEVSESLVRGEEVKILGLGTFKILEKKERMGRNPRTGESAIISARKTISFRPSAEFRSKVANA
ncbi:MAG: integration host factor subunit alpha [Alphaproteobacteria bacterium]|nr:integration host factor subunit alpha [Alphaproteobacteria bacterium]MCL2889685.1 integration host factor subunit alpha [Alphaproteobacteria bacterium]